MKREQAGWLRRLGRILVIAAPGAAALGTSCASDIRRSIVAAGLDFVEASAGAVLETLFPIEDVLAGGD